MLLRRFSPPLVNQGKLRRPRRHHAAQRGNADRLSIRWREVISLVGIRLPRCESVVRSTCNPRQDCKCPLPSAVSYELETAIRYEVRPFIARRGRSAIDSDLCAQELGQEA